MPMKKDKKNKSTNSGAQAFDDYYGSIFGPRWQSIKESFFKESRYFEFALDGCKPYYLDAASVLAALALPLKENSKILDLCAAPGGKSLVLASRMDETSSLVSNERSAERRNRLLSVVSESLPPDISG